MMRPARLVAIQRDAMACESKNAADRFRNITWCQDSALWRSARPPAWTPAACTKMSSPRSPQALLDQRAQAFFMR